jgi:hypothetical protein
MPKHSTSMRDAALRRLERLNRWLIAGSVALTAVFAEIAANAFPGKTVKTPGASKGSPHSGSSAKTSTQSVKPPVQAPTATPEREAAAEEPSSGSESAPSRESAPTQESTPSQESAPAQESAPPASESAPAQETAPTPAPAEQAPPVVSGGS